MRVVLAPAFMLLLASPSTTNAQSNWEDLFGDHGFEKWTRLDQKDESVLKNHWRLTEDDVLHLHKPGGGGNALLLKEGVGDFELSFYWKIKKDANNGIKIRVQKYGTRTLGIEYQLLDDEVKGGKSKPQHRTASIYDLKAPSESKPLNQPGQWNHSRIRLRHSKLEHWLNGTNVASVKIGSKEWKSIVKKSKFAPHQGFGENEVGQIMITDHGGEVWFRNMMLRRLDESKPEDPSGTAQAFRSGD